MAAYYRYLLHRLGIREQVLEIGLGILVLYLLGVGLLFAAVLVLALELCYSMGHKAGYEEAGQKVLVIDVGKGTIGDGADINE